MRIVIRARLIRTALRNGLRTLHHKRSAKGANISRRLCFDGEFALRVIRTGIKNAETPAALDYFSFFAFRTNHSGLFLGIVRLVALYEFAFRIARAGNESAGAVPALSHYKFPVLLFTTIRTRFARFFR